jgi:hypothetical protein
VRDLTDKGLAKSPRDTTLMRIRSQASADALSAAKDKRDAGDAAGALKLAKLAMQLDPSSSGAGALVDQLLAPPPPAPVNSEILPPLASGRGPSAAAAAVPGGRATLDVSSAKPAVGQPVDFSARIAGGPRAKVEGAAFHIVGPGIAPGTRLEAAGDGSGVYRGSFTFLQNGRYEVAFTAKADGAPVRSSRVVVVGDVKPSPSGAPPPLPPSQQGEPPPATAPTASVRWM